LPLPAYFPRDYEFILELVWLQFCVFSSEFKLTQFVIMVRNLLVEGGALVDMTNPKVPTLSSSPLLSSPIIILLLPSLSHFLHSSRLTTRSARRLRPFSALPPSTDGKSDDPCSCDLDGFYFPFPSYLTPFLIRLYLIVNTLPFPLNRALKLFPPPSKRWRL